MKPAVSIVIPCYNHGRYLRSSIQSALDHALPAEVIIVDDGSTDETPAVAAEYANTVRYIRQTNRGLSAARNVGLSAANADYVVLLDADDELLPGALDTYHSHIQRFPDIAVWYADWIEVDEAGCPVAEVQSSVLPQDAYHSLFDPLRIGPPCRYIVRKSAIAQAGSFDTGLASCEDWDLWLRIANLGASFAHVDAQTSRYRNYSTSMSKNFDRMWLSGCDVINRAEARNANCRQCRDCAVRARLKWREYCYRSILRPQLARMMRDGRKREAASLSVRVIKRDPAVSLWIGQSAIRRAVRGA